MRLQAKCDAAGIPMSGVGSHPLINHLVIFILYFIIHFFVDHKLTRIIPAKPLHNRDIGSVHFTHFPCIVIWDKLSRHLCMLTYIYLNVDKCWLTFYMPHQMFKLQIALNYGKKVTKCDFLKSVNVKDTFDVFMVDTTLLTPFKHK